MRLKRLLLFFVFCFLSIVAEAQLPNCSGTGMIYIMTFGGDIYNFDPSQPISSTNPSLNTISYSGAIDLAVSNNLNATGPSPTFYVNTSYYSGVGWSSPGYSFPSPNIGAGGGYIYGIDPSETVWRYDGVSNADSIINLNGVYAADVVADCSGNFYVLRIINPRTLYEYSSSGVLINSWTVTGNLGIGPIGMAMINNILYVGDNTIYKGVISGSTIHFSLIGNLGINASDYASCPCIPCHGSVSPTATPDTVCVGNSLSLYADTNAVSASATYSWSGPNNFSSAVMNPTITNAYTNAAGTYTITVSDTGSCTYTSYINIAAPFTISVTTNGPVCPGDTLRLNATAISGATYSWAGPNGFFSSYANTFIYPASPADSGNYVVSATVNGCTSPDTIHVSIKPLASFSLLNNNVSLCVGDTLELYANSNTTNANYHWAGPLGFNSAQKDTTIDNVQLNSMGNYLLTATLNNCSSTDTEHVTVNPILGPPLINISASPGDTICAGSNVSFTATTTSAGAAPAYQWKRNGIIIGNTTTATFTTASVSNGDSFSCEVISNAPCQAIDTAGSNLIHMYTISLPPPVVTLSVYPTYYAPGDTVTFTGHVPNGSSGFSYQWSKNGVKIAGATHTTYTSSNLSMGDTICFLVYSSVPCTEPDSAIACTALTSVINSVQYPICDLHIYPNPNNGTFRVRGMIFNSNNAKIEILNVLGQVVYNEAIELTNNLFDQQVSLENYSAGVYTLVLRTENEDVVKRVIIKP